MFIATESKVYKINSKENPDECYVGSTCLTIIEDRLERHKRDYALWKMGLKKDTYTLFTLFDKYPLASFEIILLEKPTVQTQQELLEREKHYINNTQCINKNMKPAIVDKRIRNDKPYVCEVCGISISRGRERKRHEQTKTHLFLKNK
jgi:hypothetical protein